MELKEKLNEDLKASMKAGDSVKTSTVRMLKAAISNAEMARRKSFSDEEVIDIVLSSVKQHKDSIKQYKQGNRPELVAQEEAELVILQAYLPAQMSEAELRVLIEKTISETGAATAKDMGRVIGKIMPLVKGKADNSLVSSIIRESLK